MGATAAKKVGDKMNIQLEIQIIDIAKCYTKVDFWWIIETYGGNKRKCLARRRGPPQGGA